MRSSGGGSGTRSPARARSSTRLSASRSTPTSSRCSTKRSSLPVRARGPSDRRHLTSCTRADCDLAARHSDHPYSLFAHAGVKTVLPATPEDAYGLLISAIRDDDPVLFLAPAAVLPVRGEVPDEPYTVPLGAGRIHREGRDVTVAAVGHLVHEALAVAD